MTYFDFLKELREGEPNPEKTAKVMKKAGWICCAVGVWNYFVFYIAPFDKAPFNLPQSYPWATLIVLLLTGSLFLIASKGIREMEPCGVKTGQLAIILLMAAITYYTFFVFPIHRLPIKEKFFSYIFLAFSIAFIVQFGLLAFFGIRYLERLPSNETGYTGRYRKMSSATSTSGPAEPVRVPPGKTYHESLLPFHPGVTMVVCIGVPIALIFLCAKISGTIGPESLIIFLIMFFGPTIYNIIPSSFQRERQAISVYRGGGSALMMNASWPFFRLLVYSDGIEIRFMYQRYFIPFDKLGDIPEKIGFFNRGIEIKCDLPDVPSSIRFSGFGMKKMLKELNELKRGHVNQEVEKFGG